MQKEPSKIVLILGANGRLGRAATNAFASAGWNVLAQARRPIEDLPVGARQLGIDMANAEAIVASANEASVVVYAVNPLYTDWDEKLLPLAHQGMEIAERLGALFMLPGNVYAFGEKMPSLLGELTVANPTTTKGRLRAELEGAMQTRIQRGLRSVVIRAGDFFGSGTGSWFDQTIVKSISKGKLVYPGPLDRQHAWAYLPDLAVAFVGIAELDRTESLQTPITRSVSSSASSLVGSFKKIHFAGHNVSGMELLNSIERVAVQLNIAPLNSFKRGKLPWSVIRIGGIFYPLWRDLATMSYLWRVPHAMHGKAMTELLPEIKPTPLDIAIQASLIALGYGKPVSPKPTISAGRLLDTTT